MVPYCEGRKNISKKNDTTQTWHPAVVTAIKTSGQMAWSGADRPWPCFSTPNRLDLHVPPLESGDKRSGEGEGISHLRFPQVPSIARYHPHLCIFFSFYYFSIILFFLFFYFHPCHSFSYHYCTHFTSLFVLSCLFFFICPHIITSHFHFFLHHPHFPSYPSSPPLPSLAHPSLLLQHASPLYFRSIPSFTVISSLTIRL